MGYIWGAILTPAGGVRHSAGGLILITTIVPSDAERGIGREIGVHRPKRPAEKFCSTAFHLVKEGFLFGGHRHPNNIPFFHHVPFCPRLRGGYQNKKDKKKARFRALFAVVPISTVKVEIVEVTYLQHLIAGYPSCPILHPPPTVSVKLWVCLHSVFPSLPISWEG